MLLPLYELDVCLMIVFMFQEHHCIKLADQEPQQEGQRVHQGRWNMDFLRHRVQSRQVGLLYFDILIPSI